IDGSSNTTIRDGIIQGMKSAAIIGSNFRASRLEIARSGADGVKPFNNWILEDSWIHSLGYIEDAHADGIQMVEGVGGIVRGNYFDMISEENNFRNSRCI